MLRLKSISKVGSIWIVGSLTPVALRYWRFPKGVFTTGHFLDFIWERLGNAIQIYRQLKSYMRRLTEHRTIYGEKN